MATDFEREIRAAFAEVVPREADSMLATSIRARLAERPIMRRGPMPVFSRWAVAAAVLVAVVVVVVAVPVISRVRQPAPSTNPGQVVGASPSASPSPSATASVQPSTSNAFPVHKDMFSDGNVYDFRLVSDTVGWVATDFALDRTADGGKTWTNVLPHKGTFAASDIVDADTAVIVYVIPGITIASTHDGGVTWLETPIVDSPSGAFPVLSFRSATVGTATFFDETVAGRSRVYATSDGGKTWSAPVDATLPDKQTKITTERGSVLVLNVGKADNKPFSNHLWLSTDGGRTWKKRTFPVSDLSPAGVLKWVTGTPLVEDGGRIVLPLDIDGDRAALYESQDDGQSWRLIKDWPSPSHGDYTAQFLSATDWILAAGDGSEIWSTTDGGGSWRQVRDAAPINELTTSWASPDHGWALHTCRPELTKLFGPDQWCDGTTLKSVFFETTDGGRTWTPIGG